MCLERNFGYPEYLFYIMLPVAICNQTLFVNVPTPFLCIERIFVPIKIILV